MSPPTLHAVLAWCRLSGAMRPALERTARWCAAAFRATGHPGWLALGCVILSLSDQSESLAAKGDA